MDKDCRTISSEKLHENPYFKIDKDIFINPQGKEQTYYVLRRKSAVATIAWDGQKILLVNQFRYPIIRRVWQLPAGTADTGNLLEDAKRELKEETGYTAKKWTQLGTFAYGPGTSDELGNVFLAENLTAGNHEREENEQDMFINFFAIKEIEDMLIKGEIFGAGILASLFMFKNHLAQQK